MARDISWLLILINERIECLETRLKKITAMHNALKDEDISDDVKTAIIDALEDEYGQHESS